MIYYVILREAIFAPTEVSAYIREPAVKRVIAMLYRAGHSQNFTIKVSFFLLML